MLFKLEFGNSFYYPLVTSKNGFPKRTSNFPRSEEVEEKIFKQNFRERGKLFSKETY